MKALIITWVYCGIILCGKLMAADCHQHPQFIEMQNYLKAKEEDYKSKISYLENELEKTKNQLIKVSLSNEKKELQCAQRTEESKRNFRQELSAKERTIMEYQRQLQKHPPQDELKQIIYTSTLAVIEKRKHQDFYAIKNLGQQYPHYFKPDPSTESDKLQFRKPASLPVKK